MSELSSQLSHFSNVAKDIKSLAEAVRTMRQDISDLNRKTDGQQDNQTIAKKLCLDMPSTSALPADMEEISDEESTDSDDELE